jgi:hypothetical protein
MKLVNYVAKKVAQTMIGHDLSRRVMDEAQRTLAKMEQPVATDALVKSLAQDMGHEAIYVSTPITGGTRYFNFLEQQGASSKEQLNQGQLTAYNMQVIAVNCNNAAKVADGLREQGHSAIEPSAISLPGWSQTQYNSNWMKVVNDLPSSKMLVCDGWEASYGCLLEVRSAFDKGIPVVDQHQRPISREDALKRVEKTTRELAERGFHVGLLSLALTAPVEQLPLELTH